MRHATLALSGQAINAIALTYEHRAAIVRELARRYVEHGRDHETLKDAADQAALDCKGIDEPFEIKKQFRHEVRRLERLSRGGY